MQVCPVKPEYEEYEFTFESLGVTKTVTRTRITNAGELPVWVERWRIGHEPVQSAAWIEALSKMADDKAGAVEIDRKRALKRRDLLKAVERCWGWRNSLRIVSVQGIGQTSVE
jgi:hypothetical protein